jgi:hypothetical protein
MNISSNYKNKYIKYKEKYINLKNIMVGGECTDISGNPILPSKNYKDYFNLDNLLEYEPDERITLNGNCYHIDDIYKWVITQHNDIDPLRNPIVPIDRQRIVDLKNYHKVLGDVRQNGLRLRFAPVNLQNDPEIVMSAVRQNGLALKFASDDLKNDPKIVMTAVKQYGMSLGFTFNLKKNREIVLEAVKQNGMSLQYASPNLKDDREIVLEAVKQNGMAIKYASENLQKDQKIITISKIKD